LNTTAAWGEILVSLFCMLYIAESLAELTRKAGFVRIKRYGIDEPSASRNQIRTFKQ